MFVKWEFNNNTKLERAIKISLSKTTLNSILDWLKKIGC